MAVKHASKKIVAIVFLLGVITFFHYTVKSNEADYHQFNVLYQRLYFLPLILAGFWFGLRGALATSLTISVLSIPYILILWQGVPLADFNRLLQVGVYNLVAIVLGVLRNREQKEQLRMREAENLSALGKAVSSLAHDMKTPLMAIGGFTRLVRQKLTPDDPSREKLRIVVEETRRLEDMVHEMLDFSRPLDIETSETDIQRVIGECLEVVGGAAEEQKVELRNEGSRQLPAVAVDVTRMKQLIINLVMNGVQASPEGGAVTVFPYLQKKNLVIDVMDHGQGIPPGKRAEIFTPFYTTKKDGTGLGLPIVKKIIEAHRGDLEILDNPEGGTIFRVKLPLPAKNRGLQ